MLSNLVAVCLALLPLSQGKVQTGIVRLNGEEPKWQYISKFGFGIGEGSYAVRARLREPLLGADAVWPFNLDFDIYLDEDWDKVESMPECHRVYGGVSKRKFRLELPSDGSWGRTALGGVYQVVRPHIWYFALSSCDNERGMLGNLTHSIEFDFQATNQGGSQFSIEMRYMLPANLIALSVFTLFLLRFVSRCRQCWRDAGSVHFVIWALALAMLLQYVGQILHTFHLWRYQEDGVGAKACDFVSELLFMLSQVTQTSLLIIIALGYTLLHSTTKELELVKPITVAISLVHAALVGYGKLHDDASFKYHENEGLVGWALLILRLALYAWFLISVQTSLQKGGFRLQSFLLEFQVAGSVYFLSYPVIFTFVQIFAPYLQHPIMQTGLLAMQTASHIWLAGLFLSKSNYFKVSALSASLLPGFDSGIFSADKVE